MFCRALVVLAMCCGCGASAASAIISDDLPPEREPPDDAEQLPMTAANTKVEVDINGFVSYTLRFPDLQGTLVLDAEEVEASTARLKVNMKTATTENEELGRIAKSKDFLDVERYPHAHFEIRALEKKAQAGEYLLVGVLGLHGKKKAVRVSFNMTLEKCMVKGTTAFSINRRHFGIESDTTLDSMASDEVDIRVQMNVPRKGDGC